MQYYSSKKVKDKVIHGLQLTVFKKKNISRVSVRLKITLATPVWSYVDCSIPNIVLQKLLNS